MEPNKPHRATDREIEVQDEPGMAERFQRGLQRAFQIPHKPITPKAKTRPASEGRGHKGKTGR
jgi:hypothetical protein